MAGEWLGPQSYYTYLTRLNAIKETNQSNPLGTVLYLCGMQTDDEKILTPDFHELVLSKLVKSRPLPGAIVSWEHKGPNEKVYIPQIGIMSRFSDYSVTYRDRDEGDLIVNQPIEEATGHLIHRRVSVNCYKPARIKLKIF
ncbi:MAG: hypothetical protein KC506_00710 [Nanoarchaeota archaeon]|nr:hypothetical protein [Nanoarchaeota archaeon]